MRTKSPIERAIKLLGGPTKAAAALGIENPSVVSNWKGRGSVPPEWVLPLANASGVPAQELRPDVFAARVGAA